MAKRSQKLFPRLKNFQDKVKKSPDSIYYLLIIVYIAFIFVSNLIWVSIETRPPHWDMANHLGKSLTYWERISSGRIIEFALTYRFYPPLVYVNSVLYYLFLGHSVVASVFGNLTFITILALSTYQLGKTLWTRQVGLIATAITLSTPMFVSQFKEFQIDAPLAAMVTLGLLVLIKTKEFANRQATIVFAIVFSLGLLTKWSYLFFLIGPVLLATVLALREVIKTKNFSRVKNFIIFCFIAYVAGVTWYLINLRSLVTDIASSSFAGVREGDPVVGSLASNVFYFLNIANNQLYLIPTLFLVVGLVVIIWKRGEILKKNLYLLVTIFSAIFIFTFLRNKDARYTLPIVPSIVLISVFWINFLINTWKNFAYLFLIAYSIMTFLVISFGTNLIPKTLELSLGQRQFVIFAQHGYLIGGPTNENWYLSEVVDLIAESKNNKKNLTFEGLDTIWFNKNALSYMTRVRGVGLVSGENNADFKLTRTVSNKSCTTGFSLSKQFILPDGTILLLCHRQGSTG